MQRYVMFATLEILIASCQDMSARGTLVTPLYTALTGTSQHLELLPENGAGVNNILDTENLGPLNRALRSVCRDLC
jgi:hypothetical protein